MNSMRLYKPQCRFCGKYMVKCPIEEENTSETAYIYVCLNHPPSLPE